MGIFGNAFGWPHLLIILAVILLLFGAAKLPALAKSMGQSARLFRGEMKAMKDDDTSSKGERGKVESVDADAPVRDVAVEDVPRSSSTSTDTRP